MSKVLKFGGGCLKDGRAFLQACVIIGRQKQTAVVVSAVAGVTEQLLAAIEQARRDERSIPAVLAALASRHRAIIDELCPPGRRKKQILEALAAQLAQVRRLLTGIACHGDLTPAVRARLLSYGERMAARLLAGVLNARGREGQGLGRPPGRHPHRRQL